MVSVPAGRDPAPSSGFAASKHCMLSLAGFLLLPLLAQSGSNAPLGSRSVHPTRLLVRTHDGVSENERRMAFERAGVVELRCLEGIGWSIVEVPDGRLWKKRGALESDPAVQDVCLDRGRRIAYTPNDPLWSSMWHMMTIRADVAWDTTRGSASVRVAIIDTGIETSHGDLAANVWTNPGETPGNLVDDDSNGYVDDVNGYDFAYDDPVPDDVASHGTSVAGLVAAVQDNSLGVTGVAPLSQLVAVKAGDDTGFFYDSAIVPALVYCADMGFDVAVMSFSGDGVTPAERDAVRYASNAGMVLVAAAGNSNSVLPQYPAAYDEVIAVAATENSLDKRAFFTNHGSWTALSAPGRSLRTTATANGFTSIFQGTSGSAPHVAGLAALLFAVNPSASNLEIRAAIEDTAVPLIDPVFGFWTNYGRIDTAAAVDRILELTSGSVPVRALFVAPCGGWTRPGGSAGAGPAKGPDRIHPIVLWGVGLEQPNQVDALIGSEGLITREQERGRVTFSPTKLRQGSVVRFLRNGIPFDSIVWDRADGLVFAAVDTGSTNGGIVNGGFQELYRNDSVEFTCTRNAVSEVYVEYLVRGLGDVPFTQMIVEYTRSYTDCGGGTETFEIYDWSSGSYPYGNWVTVGSTTIPATPTVENAVFAVPTPHDYVDEEGMVYVRTRATGAGPAGLVSVDRLRLRLR